MLKNLKSYKSTAAGVCLILGAFLTCLGAYLDDNPDTVPDLESISTAIALVIPGIAGVLYPFKTSTPPTKRPIERAVDRIKARRLGKLCLVLGVLLAGCTTASHTYREVRYEFDAAGNVVARTETDGKSRSKIAFASKSDAMDQTMQLEIDADGASSVMFGQGAEGLDMTAQADVANAAMGQLGPFLDRLGEAVAAGLLEALIPPLP